MKNDSLKWVRGTILAGILVTALPLAAQSFTVVDTGQSECYDSHGSLITCPAEGQPFSGQDAQHLGNQPSFSASDDGLTVYDNNTGLTWQHSPDTNGDGVIRASDKLTWSQAQARPAALNATNYGGFADWRLPSIKELYSLIDFRGTDPNPTGSDTSGLTPFIAAEYFDFAWGDTSAGERIIDAQYASSTLYVGDPGGTLFGVNFADGRIKGYGLTLHGGDKTFLVQCVRGNTGYGTNDFVDNQDGTITDHASSLMWSEIDSGEGLNWEQALAWVAAKNGENYLGYDDWRLPNAKELQSIVDYARSPATTGSAAIDPLFTATSIINEAGDDDYPSYWTSTTHCRGGSVPGAAAAYVAFGRALGYMNGSWRDVHGAGAQRSDPKAGDAADFPYGRGPQGDAIRIANFVRPVRTAGPDSPPTIAAGFTYSPASPEVGQALDFSDTSTGEPSTWHWDFGDGSSSNQQDPNHVFAAAGDYVVTLTASNPSGSDSGSHEITVIEPEPTPGQPDFSIPAVTRLEGAGAYFSSRVDIFNAAAYAMTVEVLFTPRIDLGGQPRSTALTLGPRQMLTVDDPLGEWFGFSAGETAVGSLMFTVSDGSPSDLILQSVVLATADDGSQYGQFFPGTASADALIAPASAYLSTTVDSSSTRVNFGAMAVTDGTVLDVRPVDPAEYALANARTIFLDRGESSQINDIAKGVDGFSLGDAEDYLLEVRVTAGSALVYVSVLDGNSVNPGTSDPTTILPVMAGSERVTLLELGLATGYNEFSGSASISNLSAVAAEISAELYRRGRPGVAATALLSIPAGDTIGYPDIVSELFGITDVGTVVLSTLNGARIMATGREFSILRDNNADIIGTAGQLIPGMTDDELLDEGTASLLPGLRQRFTAAGRERSHLAAFNPGADDVELSLHLYDGFSGAFEGSAAFTVRGGELVQFNDIIAAVNPDQDGAPKRLEVTADGAVFVKAFRVNPTGDPVTIDALVLQTP